MSDPQDVTTALQVLSTAGIEPRVDDYWRRLLNAAVTQQLRETCFLMYRRVEICLPDPYTDAVFTDQVIGGMAYEATDHGDCLRYWLSLAPEERAGRFYCLGAPSYCSSCGERINSIVHVKDGHLEKNACPACGVVREDTRLPRDDWWAALAEQAGGILGNLNAGYRGVMTGLIGKLAHFYVRGRIITFPDTDAGRNGAANELFHILWERFGDTQRTTCYSAARWAVWYEHIKGCSNLEGLDELPATMKAALLPALIRSCEEPGLAETIRETLSKDLSYEEKTKALRKLAGKREATATEEPKPRAKALRLVCGDEEFLLVHIDGDLDDVRSHLNIVGDEEIDPDNLNGPLLAHWLDLMEGIHG